MDETCTLLKRSIPKNWLELKKIAVKNKMKAREIFIAKYPLFPAEDVTCEDLQDPSNGRVELSGNTPGSTAEYSCNSGYRLVGTQSRTCQDDGFWSDEEPICECKLFVFPNGQNRLQSVWYSPNTTRL